MNFDPFAPEFWSSLGKKLRSLLHNKGKDMLFSVIVGNFYLQVCIGTLNFAFYKSLLRCAAQHLWVAKNDTAYKISP